MCEVCKEKPKVRVSWGLYCCELCHGPRMSAPFFRQTVNLGPDYGHESSERIKELERRVMLPVEPTAKDKEAGIDYYVGRRGDDGKIAERSPDY